MFGHPSVLSGLPARFEVRAGEDTLAYSLAADDVVPLLGQPSSLRFLTRSLLAARAAASRMDRAPRPRDRATAGSALIRRPPVIRPPRRPCARRPR